MEGENECFHLLGLKEANAKRSAITFPACNEWTLGDWGCAVAGEVGEACNLMKKVRRGEDIPVDRIADELADVVIYADLICSKMGGALEDAIRRKFAEVSKRRGYEEQL